MNETDRSQSATGAFLVIFFIFLIVFVVVRKFGDSEQVATNFQTNKNSADISATLSSADTESPIYNKYANEIYNSTNNLNATKTADQVAEEYSSELLEKVTLPPQNFTIKNISSNISNKQYANNFEKLFSDYQQKGGGSEGKILEAQISGANEILPLSDYDKETLLRLSGEYQILSSSIANLETPPGREKLAREIGIAAANVSYILTQLVGETDKNIYSLWISKYTENMFAIITDRYALQQK